MAALMFWNSFLWANFQLLPYISILPLTSEKFPNASKFLTSTFNISFIHWLLLPFSPLIWRLSFLPHPTISISVQRFSHFCFFRAFLSLLVLSADTPDLQVTSLHLLESLIPGQPSSSTTNPAVMLDDFNIHMDDSFPNSLLDLLIAKSSTSAIHLP